ncbi:MAG: insulinase family protein [Polyangiaceae bacterium]|nr:insulinase family protein [Polyangiaceae bacterium]
MRVHVESSRAIPLVGFTVAFGVGGAHDPAGKEGLARTAMRMLRRGGGGLDGKGVEQAVDRLGAEIGADASMSTVTVSGEVLARNAAALCELVGGLLARPAFEPVELSKLVRESQAELVEARDNDRGLASRALRRALFLGHPYARRVAGGTASLASLERDDVAGWHAAHLAANNAWITVYGDVDEAGGRELAARLVAGLPAGAPTPDPVVDPARRPGRELVFVDKPERTQAQLSIGTLGTRGDDDDHHALIVANTAFGGTFTARLMAEVRGKRGWSYGASSRLSLDRHREAWSMWTAPGEADAPACLALQLELLERLVADGLTDEEVAFAKSYLARSHVFEIDTAEKRAHRELDAAVLGLPAGYHASYLSRIGEVDAGRANAALRARLSPEDLVVAVVGTRARQLAPITAAIPRLARSAVVPHDLE